MFLVMVAGAAFAQNNTNSPYTRYGFGQLSDQTSTRSRAMGGVAYGLRDNSQINLLNPASYTEIDSLTFLFEGAVTFQNTNFNDGKQRLNAKNSSVDYVAMQFRIAKWMAMSAGFLPYSNVGYNLSSSKEVEGASGLTYIESHFGEGGLRQVFIGMGFRPFKNFSFGFNTSYLWGEIERNRLQGFVADNSGDNTSAGINPYHENIVASMRNVKFDIGAQYMVNLSEKNDLTLGVVYSPKANLSNDITAITQANTIQVDESSSKFELPAKYGVGVAYHFDKRLLLAADFTLEEWSKAKYMDQNLFYDRTKYSLGFEYLPSYTKRNYFANIKYRLGAFYQEPYYKVEGERGTREYGVSAGLSLPLPKSKSLINLSTEFVKTEGRTKNFLDEKYFKVTVGVVFNERWFFKRKI